MSEAFLFPTITSLPAGYDCTVLLPQAVLGNRIVAARGEVAVHYTVVEAGRVVAEETASRTCSAASMRTAACVK